MSGIPLARRGVPQIAAHFKVDADGILNVSATADKMTTTPEQSTTTIAVTADKGRLSEEEIGMMTRDAEEYREKRRRCMDAQKALEEYVHSMHWYASQLSAAVDGAISWLQSNQLAGILVSSAAVAGAAGPSAALASKPAMGPEMRSASTWRFADRVVILWFFYIKKLVIYLPRALHPLADFGWHASLREQEQIFVTAAGYEQTQILTIPSIRRFITKEYR
jgi:hypothetical protein